MKREAINPPNDWGAAYQMNQAERITEITQTINFSGQTSVILDANSPMGISVKHPNDLREQMKFILKAIDALLEQAGLTRKNIIHIRFYTINMNAFLSSYDVYSNWIKAAKIKPPQTAIGVDQLAAPELMLEVEITAAN